jgi:hypothetical protein
MMDNLRFSIGRIDRNAKFMFNAPDCQRTLRTFIQEFHQLLINSVNLVTPITYIHKCFTNLAKWISPMIRLSLANDYSSGVRYAN